MPSPPRKAPASSPPPSGAPAFVAFLYRLIDSVYHFLASLKLAVISLGSLACVLAYATFFEKWYGTAAVQEWIYRGKGFAILLAFLGANILCAALIRYPWKRRQTGFVITHAGLLILLAGSWYSLNTADEGQVRALEGDVKDELVRIDYPVVRVQQVDPHNPSNVSREWELPFRPGAFAWGPGQPRSRSIFSALDPTTWLSKEDPRNPRDVLTTPEEPFTFVAKSHIPASVPVTLHEAGPSGAPMVKIRPMFKGPGMPQPQDVFVDEEERWFVSENRLHKVARGGRPAQFAFLYVDRPELVDDFLNPPADAGSAGVARFRYKDESGRDRTYDWALDAQDGKSVTLPESDLSVKFLGLIDLPLGEAGLSGTLGESEIPLAEFEVKKGNGAAVKHIAMAMMPMTPNLIPTEQVRGEPPKKPLVGINYYLPPVLDPKTNGRFGLVEVMGTAGGELYYRVFGRSEAGKPRGEVREKGRLAKGQSVAAFGNKATMPMSLSFRVEEYFTSGVERQVCEPIVLPRSQMGNGIAASLVEMTVKDSSGRETSKEFYVRRSNTLDARWQTVTFPDAVYRISYDVDRKPLGFELALDDFQVGFDPGTEQASSFRSDVRLTDKTAGIVAKPITISMNEPLTHKGYTFYQSSYERMRDPRTDRETGRFASVFQVAVDPGRRIKYLGCILVVLGAFVQFYMRAGIASDGGTRERRLAAAKEMKRAKANGRPVDPAVLAVAMPAAGRAVPDDEDVL